MPVVHKYTFKFELFINFNIIYTIPEVTVNGHSQIDSFNSFKSGLFQTPKSSFRFGVGHFHLNSKLGMFFERFNTKHGNNCSISTRVILSGVVLLKA